MAGNLAAVVKATRSKAIIADALLSPEQVSLLAAAQTAASKVGVRGKPGLARVAHSPGQRSVAGCAAAA